MSLRSRLVGFAAIVSIVNAPAAAVYAQATHPSVERYNRIAKGSNVEEWQRRLQTAEASERLEAVTMLGASGSEEAVKPLIQALADPDPRVRIRAVDSLGLLGKIAATSGGSSVLVQLLYLNDVDRSTKLRALSALARIRDPKTSSRLMSYAESAKDERLACQAVFAIGEVAGPDQKEAIARLAAATTDTHLRRLSEDAIRKIDERASRPETAQPSILELEKRLAPRGPGGGAPGGR